MSHALRALSGTPLLLLLSAACFHPHASLETAPPAVQTKIHEVEQRYHEVAAQKAAFLANCPKDQVKTETVSRTAEQVTLPNRAGWFTSYERIASIGATACDSRFLFQLVCRDMQSYAQANHAPACEVVQDGGAAQAAVDEKNRAVQAEEKKRDEQTSR